jgi:hypothetical protein
MFVPMDDGGGELSAAVFVWFVVWAKTEAVGPNKTTAANIVMDASLEEEMSPNISILLSDANSHLLESFAYFFVHIFARSRMNCSLLVSARYDIYRHFQILSKLYPYSAIG